MTIAFLLVVALAVLIVGIVIGAIVAVVGIESERKWEQKNLGGQRTSPDRLPTVDDRPKPPGAGK